MITEFERTVIDLRAMAPGLDPAGRYLLKKAADMMENQQRQLEAQRTIIKQQAIHVMSISDELRKKEETIGHLSEVLAAARAERDVVTKRMIQLEQENAALRIENERLNKENFWLTGKEGV